MGKSFPRVQGYFGISGHEESCSELFVWLKCGKKNMLGIVLGKLW